MHRQFITILGKAVQRAAKLRGGGSALPGLVVERIDPLFIKKTLATLPYGVAVISGTNGKTTTTKMVVELLQSQGLKVFTNRTGSNYSRGIAAALLSEVDKYGNLDADIAVLELDEAHAITFVDKIPPAYCLLLNVMRDQLDRFGEIDYTAKLLQHIAEQTSKSIVLNREDSKIAAIADAVDSKKVVYYGLDKKLLADFPSDDSLHSKPVQAAKQPSADVTLAKYSGHQATFLIDDTKVTTSLRLNGIYNVFNAAGALALVRTIVGDKINGPKLIESLSSVQPAFGRGETIMLGHQPIEIILVKNPSGFRLGLASFDPEKYVTMIAINDLYADGRDMSWLWDVDFTSLLGGVATVTGIRAYDMALRLQYDEVPIKSVSTNLVAALADFIAKSENQPKRIYCTYTAMLAIRRELAKITDVEVIV